MRRRRSRTRTARSYMGGAPRRRLRWGRWIVTTLILLPACFGVGYAAAALVLFPPSEQALDELIATPRLTGRSIDEIDRELRESGLTIADRTELPHPFEPAGTVIAQSPVPGQLLQPGAGVTVAVSTGRPQLPVPDLVGLPYQNAAAVAERLGFTVNRREERGTGPAGVVTRIEPAPGTSQQLPATIVLIVTAEPEPEPEPETLPGAGWPLPGTENGAEADLDDRTREP